jgi:hypothetical protein
MALLSASGCIPDRYRFLARRTVRLSTIKSKRFFIDARTFVKLAMVRIDVQNTAPRARYCHGQITYSTYLI